MEKTIADLGALQAEAESLIKRLAPASSGATLITLSGELGAGKTAFTQALARTLGVEDAVTSPTFVLEKIYALKDGLAFKRLIHIDAYRLKEGRELGALGLDAFMEDKENLIVLEWPERVADGLPAPAIALSITPNEDGSRTFTYA